MSTNPQTISPPARGGRTVLARDLAVGASLVAAAVYLLIGLGVVDIGESTQDGAAPDLFAFGAMMAVVSVVTASLVWLIRSRVVMVIVGAVQVVVLVGYVAFAGLREPPFDLWGLLIKVCQAVVLVAVAYLALRGGASTSAATPGLPKGHVA